MIFDTLLVLVFGAIVGSFLNVVICRYNTGRSLARGRSGCMSCGHQLGWSELVPIASFFILRGHCRHCASRLSWQYPLVELSTALLFYLVWQAGWAWGLTLLGWLIAGLLLVIAVYDLRHKIIPELLVWIFAAAALWWRWQALGAASLRPSLLAGISFFLVFWFIWRLSAGKWMGLGDGKLVLGMGFLLGPVSGLAALILAFWSGAAVGLSLLAVQRLWGSKHSFTIKSEIPFAPFLIFGCFLSWLYGFNIISWF